MKFSTPALPLVLVVGDERVLENLPLLRRAFGVLHVREALVGVKGRLRPRVQLAPHVREELIGALEASLSASVPAAWPDTLGGLLLGRDVLDRRRPLLIIIIIIILLKILLLIIVAHDLEMPL